MKDSSDHFPILFKFNGFDNGFASRLKLFCSENILLTHESCAEVVKSGWEGPASSDIKGLASWIASCGRSHDTLNHMTFISIPKAVLTSNFN